MLAWDCCYAQNGTALEFSNCTSGFKTKPTDQLHNSESVEGLTPEGAVTWKGAMNKKVSVTLDKEGVYVYQCLPHVPLAMVGVIVAGEPTNLEQIKAKAADFSNRFATNKDRLDKYLLSLQ